MTGPTVAIADYGMGNLRSVSKALERVGAAPSVTSDLDEIRSADGVVLPGVGAFPAAMRTISARGLDTALRDRADAGGPILGVCLGMQLLFERSEEHGGANGLGLLPGTVEPLRAPGLKVPHIGWAEVRWEGESVLRSGLPERAAFYFVHSLAPVCGSPSDVLATAVYGDRFCAAVDRWPVCGAQFHPEKSSRDGLGLLRAFCGALRSAVTAA